jgi:hypothetical protein
MAERRALSESYPTSNYSHIEERLCLGGILSQPPPGVRAVLNVSETDDPYRAEVHRWEPSVRRWSLSTGSERQAGMYTSMAVGINRSAMVVAAYLMWRDRLTRDEALAKIESKRPRIRPFEVYQQYLSEWEKSLR